MTDLRNSAALPSSVPQQERSIATRQRLLDAAVDVLIEEGYAGLSATKVASRAGVTRGAQQHHFPHKATLVAEALSYLTERVMQEARESLDAVPAGPKRVERLLDVIYERFDSRLFAAMFTLSMAARHHPELREAEMSVTEQAVGSPLHDVLREVLRPEVFNAKDFPQRLGMAYAVARGLGSLRLLGHPPELIDRQWRFARTQLIRLLDGEDVEPPPPPKARRTGGRRNANK